MLETWIDGRYRVLSEISCGATVRNAIAYDEISGTQVHVKEYRKKVLDYSGLEYIRAYANLRMQWNHPAIAKVYRFWEEQDCLFLIQEYIDGESLKQENICKQKTINEAYLAVQLTLEIISALQYLYARSPSVLVRNLSPSVLVRKQDGGILLTHECDFACMGTQYTEKTALDIRNMDFLAPEQFVGMTDIRSNIYNIGAILSYMLNGKTPKENPGEGQRFIPVKMWICGREIQQRNRLSRIIQKCTQPDPDQRYQTLEELENKLKKAISSCG